MQEMSSEKKDEILENFSRFKHYLADKVHKAENLGMNEDQLAKTTEFAADWLAKNEEPRNREQHLLQQLWQVGDKDEQQHLSRMLLKMVREQA